MKILLKAFLLTAPINFVYAAEGQKSAGLPQMDIATFPSQLFWLVITFFTFIPVHVEICNTEVRRNN